MRARLLRPTLSLLIATLFTIGSQGLIAAETPSPAAVGMGGRVEVTEAGYALTLPDDWAFVVVSGDDVGPVLDEVSTIFPELADTVESFLVGGADFSFLAFAPTGANCNVIDRPSEGLSLDQKVAAEMEGMQGLGDMLAFGPEVADLDLPAGAASRIDISLRFPDYVLQSSSYHLTDGATFHTLTCTDLMRPDDYWASIVETFEFLPTAD